MAILNEVHGDNRLGGVLAPPPAGARLAFALGGGGFLGATQVGCLEALHEAGLVPDLLVGTSVGALNGAWLARSPALDGLAQLKKIWTSIRTQDVFGGGWAAVATRFLLGRDHLYANTRLRTLITTHLREATFEDLRIPLYVTATNMTNGGLEVFHSGPLLPALLASTAIPGVLPSVVINGLNYLDGALLGDCNVGTAWQQGATHVIALKSPVPPPGKGFGIFEPVARALQASLGRLWQMEVEWARGRCHTLTLCPEVDLSPRCWLRTKDTERLIRESRDWASEFLRKEGQGFLASLRADGPQTKPDDLGLQLQRA